jgi:hypothetical protein
MKTAVEIKETDHAEWISKLKSYKHELVSLEGSLAELAANSKQREVLARVEHFQNQFIVQRVNVNEILHALKMDEREQLFRSLHPSKNSGSATNARKSIQQAETFEKTMSELTQEFKTFAAKHRQ